MEERIDPHGPHEGVRHFQFFRQHGAIKSDPDYVLSGVFIVYLGGPGQSLYRVFKSVFRSIYLQGQRPQKQGLHDNAVQHRCVIIRYFPPVIQGKDTQIVADIAHHILYKY